HVIYVAVPLPRVHCGHVNIVDGNGPSILVADRGGDLLCARLDAVGDGRNIDDDRLVHFVDRILDRGEGNRAIGAAGRDHDRRARGGVITGQGGGAGEGQVDGDGLG